MEIEWKPVKNYDFSAKTHEILLVCGVNSADPLKKSAFWAAAVWVPEFSWVATPEEIAEHGTGHFTQTPESFLCWWPEGWYEVSECGRSATLLESPPLFYASVELPKELLFELFGIRVPAT